MTAPDEKQAAPASSARAELVEFAFHGLPHQIATGPLVWGAPNPGKQIHDLVVYKLAPGVAPGQVISVLESTPAAPDARPAPGASTGPPFTALGRVAPMVRGKEAWFVWNADPGEYVAICFVPDLEAGAPHFALGMIMAFSVS